MDPKTEPSEGEPAPPLGPIGAAATFALGMVAALCLLSMMLITTADVLGRYLFAAPMPGAFEITQILLAATIFAGLPIVTLKEEHVTVSLVSDRLPTSVRRVHAALAGFAGAAILGVLAWRLGGQAARLASYGDTTSLLRIPLSPLAWTMSGLTALAGALAAGLAISRLRNERAASAASPRQVR